MGADGSTGPAGPAGTPFLPPDLRRIVPGRLLVAMPVLSDPSFARTVVYLLDDDAEGTLGVVLTRPSSLDVLDLAPRWWPHAAEPRRVHVGGPCQKDAALAVAVGRPRIALPFVREVVPASGRAGDRSVYVVDLDADPEPLGPMLSGLRLFAGYAGWSPGQLAEEIAEGAWVSVPGRPDDVVAPPGTDLWREVLDRQSGAAAFLRACTDSPALN